MPELVRRPRKTGLPPGTLIHTGERRAEEVVITVIDYDEEHVVEKRVKKVQECFPFRDTATVTWINIDGLHRPDIIEAIGNYYGFHPLVLEDILSTGQRPKLEDYGDHLFIVLRMLMVKEGEREVPDEQVSIILGTNFVISFQESVGDIFDPVRERIRNGKGRLRKSGADYLAYTLIDSIVDHYFLVLERLGEEIEGLEDELVSKPTVDTLHSIYGMKRDMVFLRKSVWPLREVISQLQRGDSKLLRPPTLIYLRDVYDHTIQVMDTIESLRDMTAGMLDTYLSSISNRMNEVMKVLTIIATIFIPLSFVAGLYGMNFANMPELGLPWGYYMALTIMAFIGGSMVLYFRRRKWI